MAAFQLVMADALSDSFQNTRPLTQHCMLMGCPIMRGGLSPGMLCCGLTIDIVNYEVVPKVAEDLGKDAVRVCLDEANCIAVAEVVDVHSLVQGQLCAHHHLQQGPRL